MNTREESQQQKPIASKTWFAPALSNMVDAPILSLAQRLVNRCETYGGVVAGRDVKEKEETGRLFAGSRCLGTTRRRRLTRRLWLAPRCGFGPVDSLEGVGHLHKRGKLLVEVGTQRPSQHLMVRVMRFNGCKKVPDFDLSNVPKQCPLHGRVAINFDVVGLLFSSGRSELFLHVVSDQSIVSLQIDVGRKARLLFVEDHNIQLRKNIGSLQLSMFVQRVTLDHPFEHGQLDFFVLGSKRQRL